MQWIITIVGAIAAISIIIIIHELGHFGVARLFGVKVEAFAIGFGPTIYSRITRSGMVVKVGLLPIGGFIKMQGDETQSHTSRDATDYLAKPVWQRMLIIIAGPLINFVLAIVIYGVTYSVGVPTFRPIIHKIIPRSIAAQAGLQANDKFVAINRHATPDWSNVLIHLLIHYGDTKPITATVHNVQSNNTYQRHLNLKHWTIKPTQVNIYESLGFKPLIPVVLTTIDKIIANSPAQKAGLQPGDTITAINHKPTIDLEALQKALQKNGTQPIQLTIRRQQRLITLPITPYAHYHAGKRVIMIGFIGKLVWPKGLKTVVSYSPLTAMAYACKLTFLYIHLNWAIILKLIVGTISFKALSGPVMILTMGGQAASQGFIPYFHYIAYISTAVGFLNLLPIPGLDGGHFMFQLIELIRGKAVSFELQRQATLIGLLLLLLLVLFVTHQDITRLLHLP